MDIPRPERKRQKRLRQTAIAAVGVLVLAAVTVGLTRLEPAAPSVDNDTVWWGTVTEGEMLVEVRGSGTLVPPRRWIGSQSDGHVDRIVVLPGAMVEADTVLVEMSNPDLMQLADTARFDVESAKATLAEMELSLRNKQLDQQAAVASARSEYERQRLTAEAERQAGDAIPRINLQRSDLLAEQLKVRLDIEKERLDQFSKSMDAQLAVPRTRVAQAQGALDRREEQIDALAVRAGVAGVVQEVLVDEGQRVALGANIARVARPDELLAELKVSETQAKDVVIGQRVRVDTRNGVVEGKVMRVDPVVQGGTVQVDVELTGQLPRGARPDQSVDGTIEIQRLTHVKYTGRPTYTQPNTTVGLYKKVEGGRYAIRVPVEVGVTSVNSVEIIRGLEVGEEVILSDTSAWDDEDRIRLK